MKKTILNSYSLVIILFYIVMVFWWISIFTRHSINTKENYIFGLAIGLLAMIGGLIGIIKSKKFGLLKSIIGKSILFLSLGTLTWSIGTIIFAYYNLNLNIEVPYPSLADIAYIVSWPLWTVGMFYLLKVLGIKRRLKNITGKSFFIIIPLITIVASYYLLFVVARGGLINFSNGQLKLFFDLAYPIGDIVIITFAFLIYGLSVNYLGGILRFPILIIIFGFLLNYLADFSFSYTTTNNTFYVASWVDFIFTTAMFVLGLGLSFFNPSLLDNIKQKSDGLTESPDITNMNVIGVVPILKQIMITIIKRQERIAGQIAWEEAKDVDGLVIVDQVKGEISISDNSNENFKKIVDQLIEKYKNLFGDIAVEVSKNAVRYLIVELPSDQVPESLK